MLSKGSLVLEPAKVKFGWNEILLFLLFGLTFLSYFLNLGINNIWTPNESFYAEAVREMLQSGNFLDIQYNYQPRFNKPPLLYWLMAISSKVFGLNEFSIRLVIALCGTGTIFLVYRLGALLEGKRLGVLSAAIMAFSFQFVINARYGSPAVPLTFFFTATLYFFLEGYLKQKFYFILWAYLFLGLTVLMKGYPYLIVISLIITTYILLDTQLNWKRFWKALRFLKPWFGLPLAFFIGMSWVAYMFLTHGQEFYEVFMDETYRRAFTRKSSFKPFYYLEANLWGFLPYSLSFYLALIYLVWDRFRGLKKQPVVQFSFAWFVVMLLVFTIAKGKIPTYFIQAHGGMSLLTAYFILSFWQQQQTWKSWFNLQFLIPGLLFVVLSVVMVYFFGDHWVLFSISILPLLALLVGHYEHIHYLRINFFPFYSFLVAYLLFAWIVLPKIEEGFRNHDEIGQAIIEQVPDNRLPILIEDFLLHNLPYYAERRVIEYQSMESIQRYLATGAGLVLAPASHTKNYKNSDEIWRGILYTGSESRTLEFIIETLKYKQGQESRFEEYVVLYKKE